MITEEILKVSRSTGKDVLVTFNNFLDYCIDCFTPPRPIPDGIDKNSVFFNAFASLQLEYLKGINNHGWCDPLGDVFMDLTKGIQSYRGQYFTPPSICDMMCDVTVDSIAGKSKTSCGAFGKRIICNDPACGSSRNLIALASKFIDKPRNELPYFVGEDIDATCCKMSAINMCVHGIPGEVVCHETRRPIPYTRASLPLGASRTSGASFCSTQEIREMSTTHKLKTCGLAKAQVD